MVTSVSWLDAGAQRVGMTADLALHFPLARHTLEEVNEALSFNLSSLMHGTDEATLNLTEHAQPALLAHAVAVWRVLQVRPAPSHAFPPLVPPLFTRMHARQTDSAWRLAAG